MQAGLRDLISPEYEAQIRELHSLRPWGEHGHSHAAAVVDLIMECSAASVLDYGCGVGSLRESLPHSNVREYDPGVEGKEALPGPADLVVCTDVLEHIEPDCLDAVLAHLFDLTRKVCFAAIATRPANALLPNGDNAHLIVQPAGWWIVKLLDWDWRVEVRAVSVDELIVCLRKIAP